MKTGRIDIGAIRRDQIVSAAVAVIAEQGIQNLSLSEIEKKVGMSRGQLTYYFRTKEDILLAVFDRMVAMMCAQREKAGLPDPETMLWSEVLSFLLGRILNDPDHEPAFNALQYTFLSQISHRADFRERLASLYEHWRGRLTAHLERDLGSKVQKPIPWRALATLIQAIIHGLVIQASADPQSVNAEEMIELVLDVLETYLHSPKPRMKKVGKRSTRSGQPSNGMVLS